MPRNRSFSSSTNMETIPIPGAEIYYDKNFLSLEEATTLFSVLRTSGLRGPKPRPRRSWPYSKTHG